MKTSTITSSFSPLTALTGFTAVMALLLSPARLNSQLPPPPKSPETALSEVKAANQALLEKQQATIQKLDTVQEQADQLRIFTKRG